MRVMFLWKTRVLLLLLLLLLLLMVVVMIMFPMATTMPRMHTKTGAAPPPLYSKLLTLSPKP
jgi:hypothetical protein